MNYVRLIYISLKCQSSTPPGCKDRDYKILVCGNYLICLFQKTIHSQKMLFVYKRAAHFYIVQNLIQADCLINPLRIRRHFSS